MFVEHHGSKFLHKVESSFMDLHKIYITRVHDEFESEKDKIASLRYVNTKSLLGNKESKLYVNSLETEKTINFDAERQIVKTNQTCLVMKNIYNQIQKSNDFKSKFMFIELKFIESDENIKLIYEAMQCGKKTCLIIDGHDDVYEDFKIQEKLAKLLKSSYVGRIILILHETQNFNINAAVVEHDPMIFTSSDFTIEFKGSLKVNFQGSEFSLEKLVESSKIEFFFEDYFKTNSFKFFTKETISFGNQLKITHDSHLEGTYWHEKSGSRTLINLNDNACLVELFKKNPHIIINCKSSQIKEKSESLKMCMRLKSVYPDHWIVDIDFSCSNYPFFNSRKNESDYLNYFLKECLKLNLIESKIFRHFIDIGKVIFIFEGIDINSPYVFNNIKKIIKFLAKLKKLSKICLFTRPKEIQSLKDKYFEEIIRLTNNFKQLESSLNEEPRNDEMLKTKAHYFDISMREFSRKMFDIGNNDLHNDTEGLKDKIDLNNQADSFFTSKIYDKSIEHIIAAFEIESNSESALSQDIHSMNLWGNVLFEQSKYSEAIEKYDEAEKLASYETNDRKKNYLINKAVCHYKQKEYDQSIELLNESLKIASNSGFSKLINTRACYIWGFTLQEKKEYEEAIEQFENAHIYCGNYKIKYQRRFSLINQANSYFFMKTYEKTIELIQKSFEVESDFKTDWILDVYSTNLWGNALLYLKNYSGALQKYENALNMCTDEMNDERKFNLNDAAFCHRRLKNYKIAIELIVTALKINSETRTAIVQNACSMILWGHVLKDQKNFSAAIEKYENATRLCTDEMNDEKKLSLINAAKCHRSRKNYNKAIELMETALKIKSETGTAIKINAYSMILWGHVLKDQKNFSAAIEKYEHSTRMCTDEMNEEKKVSLINAAECHRKLKNYNKAIELMETALKIESETEAAIVQNAYSMILWGHIMRDQKNFSAAIEKYENATRLCTDEMNDKKKIFLNNAAECHRKLKNYEKAIELVETALQFKSDTEDAIEQNARSMNLWGNVLFDQKNYSAAIDKFEAAANMCTDEMKDEKKLYLNNAHEANCHKELKNFDKANVNIGEALKIESDTDSGQNQNKARNNNVSGIAPETQEFELRRNNRKRQASSSSSDDSPKAGRPSVKLEMSKSTQ